jgi:hypothetical protein
MPDLRSGIVVLIPRTGSKQMETAQIASSARNIHGSIEHRVSVT